MTELENGITKLGCVNHDCEKCKAKVEQEPVAYLYHDASNLEELLEAERKCLNMHSVLISIRRHEAYRNETPLYTHPPVPTAQPKEEIPKAVFLAISNAGLTLVKTHNGYKLEMFAGIKAQSEQPKEPGQEPVTWRNAAIRVGEDLCSVGPFGYYDMTAEQWLDWALSVVTVHALPPQRKPLTDEQMFEMAEIAWRHGWASCRDAEYVGEEAEDERWGMVGAEVVQDIAAHGIKGDA